MQTNTAKHAEFELGILVKSAPNPDDRPIVEPFISEILALCEKFGLSGQSGGSAPYTATVLAQVIKKLCLREPICPITGIDEEWMDVTEHNDGEILYQNKRCSNLFKDTKGAFYLDAIIWKSKTTGGWNGKAVFNGLFYSSRQYIKSFPFVPKTFYVDVKEFETPDNTVFEIKNYNQLKKVFEYYKEKI